MTARVFVGVAITAVVALIVVIVFYTTTNRPTPGSEPTIPASAPTPTMTPTKPATPTPTATTPGWTDAQYKLYNLVPSGFADGCAPLEVTDSKLRPKSVAAIRCDPGGSGTPDYLEYYRYRSKSATEAAYERYTGKAASAGCDGNGTKQDQLTCFERGTTRLIVWDDPEARILYRAGSQELSDSQQWAWWQKGSSW